MLQLCHVDESHNAYQFYFICDPDAQIMDIFNAITKEASFTVKPEVTFYQEYSDALLTVKREFCFFLNHSSILNSHFIAVALKLDLANIENV